MAVDQNLYLRLLSIALEQARHYGRLYTQTWIAGIIFGGAAVAMLRYLVQGTYRIDIILGVAIPLGILAVLFFNLALTSYVVRERECQQRATDIGLILLGRRQPKSSEVKTLIKDIAAGPSSTLEKRTFSQLKTPRRRLFWLIVPIALWVPTCLFLAGSIP